MKTKYRKVYGFRAEHEGDFMYVWNGKGYHRPIQTFNEIRQNTNARRELRGLPRSAQPRGSRSRCELDAWNDENRGRDYGRSWKDYTRHRKQWMVGNDPKPVADDPPRGLAARIIAFLETLPT